MADKESPQDKGFLTPEEFQHWLKDEIRDSAKAHELRVKDATAFVTAYAEGKLSPEEANDHLMQYDRRWGEALFGATTGQNVSDAEILLTIDSARDEQQRRQSTQVERLKGHAQDTGWKK
jgi:hypothetical protein